MRISCASAQAADTRIHTAILACASGSCQWPTTTLRFLRIRVTMCPNSRSPCADWLRFMKSISIVSQGISLLNCVWKCRRGLRSSCKPCIHILAGEKVCIHVMTPIQCGSLLAAFKVSVTSRAEFTVPLYTIFTGRFPDSLRPFTISLEWASTAITASPPYKSCAPVTNQTSKFSNPFIAYFILLFISCYFFCP